jgi:hypothetical protein
MLTLKRFRAKAESYGADLKRWPEALRGEGEALLKVSPEARAVLDEARRLDQAIAAGSAEEDARLWPPGEQDAALARLRASVVARIAAPPGSRPEHRRAGWALSLRLRWAGLVTAGGFAIMAGLLIGGLYAGTPEPDSVLTILQPQPIEILAD